MINWKIIGQIMGFLVHVETVMLLCTIGVSLYYGGDDLNALIITAGITLLAGGVLRILGRGATKDFSKRDSMIIVSFSWVVVSLFGMLPFTISGYIPNVSNAFFEAISGFTSTGATILDDIEALPHGLLFWRSLIQWIGGLGIVVFTLAVLPIFGVGGVQLFAAEASGLNKDKVHPRIGVTAKWIWGLYIGMTAILAVLLYMGGMNVFDSINHAFTTTATGGFSTKQASIAYFNSSYIEYIIAIFMFISGINFTLLLLLTKGKIKKVLSNTEVKYYFISVFIFTVLIAVGVFLSSDVNAEQAFRLAFFQVSSIHTSTGFATFDYMLWPSALWGLLTIVMIIGACAGSTTGGIKCIRVAILTKISKNEFKRIIHPNAVLPVRINKQVAPPNIVSSVLAFIFLYLLIIISSSLFLLALDVPPMEAIGTVVSAIGNMGPGLGMTGPAYSWNSLPEVAKWLTSFLMLLGRLELFTLLVLFTPHFWKKR
ncbi:TrkH family potassium uptake protein [Bacteroides sp. 214]|uniref:TrkH family potassium uptake protein n=1 Tax=Bacteroides sp. 214 TaxID=2302935 RepID=UPI0013D2FAFB|nr:TrkH family potassium uptake protein [Bacteroides sp. 214]NDW13024.1 TrkH family potassium uptake protein [Bacteroides sp. 214]